MSLYLFFSGKRDWITPSQFLPGLASLVGRLRVLPALSILLPIHLAIDPFSAFELYNLCVIDQ